MNNPVGVGIVGSQFISVVHACALQRNPNSRLIGVASPAPAMPRVSRAIIPSLTISPITATC